MERQALPWYLDCATQQKSLVLNLCSAEKDAPMLSSHLEHPADSHTLQGLSTLNMRIIAPGNEHAKHATTRGRVVYSRHAGFQHLGAGQHGYWVCGDMWGDYLC